MPPILCNPGALKVVTEEVRLTDRSPVTCWIPRGMLTAVIGTALTMMLPVTVEQLPRASRSLWDSIWKPLELEHESPPPWAIKCWRLTISEKWKKGQGRPSIVGWHHHHHHPDSSPRERGSIPVPAPPLMESPVSRPREEEEFIPRTKVKRAKSPHIIAVLHMSALFLKVAFLAFCSATTRLNRNERQILVETLLEINDCQGRGEV